MTQPPVVAALGVVGLLVGSLLTTMIHRLPREESLLWPSSRCPSCEEPLRARHTVPLISWLALRGRCAYCHDRISARYPLVELGTAVLFAAITLRFGLTVQLPAYLFLTAVGVVLAMIEFDVRRLPDSVVLPSYVVSVLLLMPAGAAAGADWTTATRALTSMAVLWLVFFVMALVYPGAVEMGDAKLAGLLGLYLGWLSWGTVLIGTFGAFLIAAVSAGTVAAGRRVTAHAVPFAPCLVSAAVLALFVAVPITSWYGTNVVAF